MAIKLKERGGKVMRVVIVVLAVTIGLTYCATTPASMSAPVGFAEYRGKKSVFRAISPDGVILRVRTTANKPTQTLEFWSEALKVHMISSGYIKTGEDSFTSPAGGGTVFEWSAPLNGESWVYLTAIAVNEDQITIAEAAGEYHLYQEYKDSIVAKLATLIPEEK